jgi:hypothetical protein
VKDNDKSRTSKHRQRNKFFHSRSKHDKALQKAAEEMTPTRAAVRAIPGPYFASLVTDSGDNPLHFGYDEIKTPKVIQRPDVKEPKPSDPRPHLSRKEYVDCRGLRRDVTMLQKDVAKLKEAVFSTDFEMQNVQLQATNRVQGKWTKRGAMSIHGRRNHIKQKVQRMKRLLGRSNRQANEPLKSPVSSHQS